MPEVIFFLSKNNLRHISFSIFVVAPKIQIRICRQEKDAGKANRPDFVIKYGSFHIVSYSIVI